MHLETVMGQCVDFLVLGSSKRKKVAFMVAGATVKQPFHNTPLERLDLLASVHKETVRTLHFMANESIS